MSENRDLVGTIYNIKGDVKKMRWILVFVFLYLIPLIIVFKNYNNFKRSCIYSSIYVVLVTTIVISNIYMSGLNKIEEAMYYQHYASEYIYKNKEASKPNKVEQNKSNKAEQNDSKKDKTQSNNKNESNDMQVTKNEQASIDEKTEKITNQSAAKEIVESKTDTEIIYSFKEDIYEIEKIALVPMRDCMPYTKNISENIKKLSSVREDLEYARQKCKETVAEYENMEIPDLSKEQYTNVLDSARNDLIKTYELREKAMESAINLVDTKNPKYIGKVTEYLKLSDNHITSFKERISDLKRTIDDSNNTTKK